MDEIQIQQAYFKETLSRDINDIFQAQLDIATKRIYRAGRKRQKFQGLGSTVQGRSGKLKEALSNKEFTFYDTEEGVIASTSLPTYIRFLDMKKKGNFQIYNRQIWGILYNNALKDIRHDYSKETRDRIRLQLEEAFPGEHSK